MSVKYGSGRGKFVGQSIVYPFPIPLDATQHNGAVIVADDGQLYYSNGFDWVIPTEDVEISRPSARVPTNATEQTQLRLSAFRSPAGLTQVGVLFEISVNGVDFEAAEQRLIVDEFASSYQLQYPEDGFEPGDEVFWRGKYLGSDGAQSEFSIPYRQTFPDLVTTPTPVTRQNAITGTFTLSAFESPAVFGLAYHETQVEFYAEGATPGVDTPITTVTQQTGAVTTAPIPPLVPGESYVVRGRYGAKVNISAPSVYSDWSIARTIFLGAASIVLEYDINLTTGRTITIPLGASAPLGEAYSVTIDWGDGTSQVFTTGGNKSKTYAAGFAPEGGRFTVTISGRMTSYGGNPFNALPQPGLVRVNNIGFAMGLTSLSGAWRSTALALEYVTPNLPETVTDLSYLFYLSAANPASVSGLDTRNVLNMEGMFRGTTVFNQPIGTWDVSKVSNMSEMFRNAGSFNQPIGTWNTGSVTNMASMFESSFSPKSPFNQAIGTWDMSKVTTTNNMFRECAAFNNGGSPNINNWNVSSVTNMVGMFDQAAAFNQPIGDWDTSNVTGMASMFAVAIVFNQPIGSWNVSKVTSMNAMFRSALVFNQPLNTWVTTALTDTGFMFYTALAFNQPLNNWNMSKVTVTSHMFGDRTPFDQDIGSWNLSSLIDAAVMFGNGGARFNNGGSDSIKNWDVSKVTVMERMFSGASLFNQPIGSWNVSNVTNMTTMFSGGALAMNQDLGGWNLRKAGVILNDLGLPGTNQENYSRTLIGWANNLAENDGPYSVTLTLTATRLYNANNYVTGERFTNAAAARAFLVGGRVVSVTGASDANANTTYTYNGTTQTYVAANGWFFAVLGSSWALYDATAVLQATGSGGNIGTGPHTATSWTGVLAAATVLRTGAGWTITGDAAA